ncbi:MAG: response regulator transcription factor [Candidatus Dormibacterales bacterium]
MHAEIVNAGGQPLRVVLVDDHELVRDGLRFFLGQAGGIEVVGEAASPADAVRETERTRPDVVVMDVRLAGGSGIEATREIRGRVPETKVLMLTSFADDEALLASVLAGASGYVPKRFRTGELVRAIRDVGAGQNLLDTPATSQVRERLRKGKHLVSDDRLARLSPQEERILSLVAEGKTNRQIGQEMGLAEKTVKNYVSSVMTKLEVSRRAEAAAYFAGRSGTRA